MPDSTRREMNSRVRLILLNWMRNERITIIQQCEFLLFNPLLWVRPT